MTNWARYLHWLKLGKCQICGEESGGRVMCPACEDEVNREAEEVA